ncbi:hypothetical protein KL931_001761 [Ogataea haglerorum]|nr:hypothetical protein KL931_001761 [Ogataea haglerorum]
MYALNPPRRSTSYVFRRRSYSAVCFSCSLSASRVSCRAMSMRRIFHSRIGRRHSTPAAAKQPQNICALMNGFANVMSLSFIRHQGLIQRGSHAKSEPGENSVRVHHAGRRRVDPHGKEQNHHVDAQQHRHVHAARVVCCQTDGEPANSLAPVEDRCHVTSLRRREAHKRAVRGEREERDDVAGEC